MLPDVNRQANGGPQPADVLVIFGITGDLARVMPCSELFDRQPQAYRDEVLPPHIRERVAIEQASALGWARYVGDKGAIVAMNTFGASAPLKELVKKFGFTPEAVSAVAREVAAK